MAEIFIGVHSITDGLAGISIRAATELYCKPPWVLGPAHPASHAYVAWHHGDGFHYRLDAHMGSVSKVSRWDGPYRPSLVPAAHWKVRADSAETQAGIECALSLTGVEYDAAELVAQLVPVKSVSGMDFVRNAVICTHLTTKVLTACGLHAFVAALPDRYPERLGRAAERCPELFRVFG